MLGLCSSLDNAVVRALEDVICSRNPSGRTQAQRGKKHGGFGPHSSSLYCAAAYVASVSFSAQHDEWDPLDAHGSREAASQAIALPFQTGEGAEWGVRSPMERNGVHLLSHGAPRSNPFVRLGADVFTMAFVLA